MGEIRLSKTAESVKEAVTKYKDHTNVGKFLRYVYKFYKLSKDKLSQPAKALLIEILLDSLEQKFRKDTMKELKFWKDTVWKAYDQISYVKQALNGYRVKTPNHVLLDQFDAYFTNDDEEWSPDA